MGSLNSSKIQIVSKENKTLRNEGNSLVTTRILSPQTGPTSNIFPFQKPAGPKKRGINDNALAEPGEKADRVKTQYSVLNLGEVQKVATSDDVALDGGVIATSNKANLPNASTQPEIKNKPVSQMSAYNTGARIVVRDSSSDLLVDRHPSNS